MTPDRYRDPRFAFGIMLAVILIVTGCTSEIQEKDGIHFGQPVVGTRETYIGFNFGGPKTREETKTYTRDSMTIEVVQVQENTMTLLQKLCYAHDTSCTAQFLTLNRTNGRIDVSGENGWSYLETANLFPSGIFTDSARRIDFTGYVPNVSGPAVGIVPEYRLYGVEYRNVTVMVDPTGIPIDVGGRCLILSREKRLLEFYSYHVFGTDGGWEVRD